MYVYTIIHIFRNQAIAAPLLGFDYNFQYPLQLVHRLQSPISRWLKHSHPCPLSSHLQLSRDGYGALEGDPPKPGRSRKRRADAVQHRGVFFQPFCDGFNWFHPGKAG